MKRSHSDEELSDIAAELGIDVAFVEKDIFATEVLAIVFDTGCEIVFGGGTSLSKAYDLIQRFSDDLDFRICLPHHDLAKNQVRKQMTEIRHSILEAFRAREDLSLLEDSILARNESRFFRFEIEYTQHHNRVFRLLPRLKLEFSLSETLLPPERRGIHSLYTRLIGEAAPLHAKVVSPLETAANKYSALLWRVGADAKMEQHQTPDEPAVLRHLYDLASLSSLIFEQIDLFKDLAKKSFEADRRRGRVDEDADLLACSERVVEHLGSVVHPYENEYNSFVAAMSYAPDHQRITYTQAVELFKKISSSFGCR